MKERIKSVILLLLVLNSLVLTSFLNFYNFNDSSVSLSEYYPQIKFGDNIEVEQLIKPSEIIIHFGDNTHTLIRTDNEIYNLINDEMRNWIFYNFSLEIEKINWNEIVENNKGVELIFSNPLDYDSLFLLFEINSSNKYLNDISRLWLFIDQNDNLQVYFISDSLDKVYSAKIITIDQFINHYLDKAKDESKYSYYESYTDNKNKLVQQMYYIPDEEFNINKISETYTFLSESDLIQMLFLDPSSVRNVYEQDTKKAILYTDGINSLQYNTEGKYISYYQPILEYNEGFNVERDTTAAIKFINQHGGWDGEYLLEHVELKYNEDRTELVFRKYVNGFPLIEDDGTYGYIKIKVFDSLISLFQRSIVFIDKSEIEVKKTLSGEELLNQLAIKGVNEIDIISLKLIYNVERIKNNIILDPYWLVDMKDETNLKIPAYK